MKARKLRDTVPRMRDPDKRRRVLMKIAAGSTAVEGVSIEFKEVKNKDGRTVVKAHSKNRPSPKATRKKV
jgi:hypothetical protein